MKVVGGSKKYKQVGKFQISTSHFCNCITLTFASFRLPWSPWLPTTPASSPPGIFNHPLLHQAILSLERFVKPRQIRWYVACLMYLDATILTIHQHLVYVLWIYTKPASHTQGCPTWGIDQCWKPPVCSNLQLAPSVQVRAQFCLVFHLWYTLLNASWHLQQVCLQEASWDCPWHSWCNSSYQLSFQ
jgi:hypothetical protein